MKCLEKDRTRRYETANGLAADLKRHLSNEAVVARPPTPLYRFQKMVRRNKLAFAAAGAVMAALLVGLFLASWQAIRANNAEHTTRRNAYAAEINVAFHASPKTIWAAPANCLTASGPSPAKKTCAVSSGVIFGGFVRVMNSRRFAMKEQRRQPFHPMANCSFTRAQNYRARGCLAEGGCHAARFG